MGVITEILKNLTPGPSPPCGEGGKEIIRQEN
jgi:hypothetical protein